VVVNVEGNQDLPTDHSMTDGMAISFVDEQDCGFFGERTNHSISFISKGQSTDIKQALLPTLPLCVTSFVL